MGGNNNAFTTEDYTAYYINFPSAQLELAAQLEADRMANLLIPAEKFASEVNVVKEERRWRTENSPFGMMWEMLGATAYAQHSYRWPVIGWMGDLERLTRDQAYDYYKAHYLPNNAIVVVVGDFVPVKALEIIKRNFGHLKAGELPTAEVTQEVPQSGERRVEIIRDVETGAVMVAYHIPAKGDRDFYTLEVLERILAKGRSARLYHDLVYTRQLAEEVGAMTLENRDPGLFLAYAVPLPKHTTAELERELRQALERLKTEDVTDYELQKAINQAEASFIFGQQKNFEVGSQLGSNEALRDWQLVNDFLPKIRAVTKQDIRRVAAKVFTRMNRSVVTLVPAKEVKD